MLIMFANAYASISSSIRRTPPPSHILYWQEAVRLEYKNSGRAASSISITFEDFSKVLPIADVWYRLMAILYDFPRERTESIEKI